MSMGICDVKGCTRKTHLAWCSKTERIGRQVCEFHHRMHLDPDNRFNLFDAFSFKKISTKALKSERGSRLSMQGDRRCACGAPRKPKCTYCEECAKEREKVRKREYQRRKRAGMAKTDNYSVQASENKLVCKDCGGPRKPRHVYCPKCAWLRKRKSNRERQRKYRRNKIAQRNASSSIQW